MRGISTILAILIIIVITIASIAVLHTVIIDYIKSRQPRGEIVDITLVARRSQTQGGVSSIDASLFIMCAGPKCNEYVVKEIKLRGYDRTSDEKTLYELAEISKQIKLKQGVSKIDIVGYYPASYNISEVVVRFKLCKPGNAVCSVISKSATVG